MAAAQGTEAMIHWLVEHVLTAGVMTLLWLGVLMSSAVVAWRLRRPAVALLAAGALPWFVFYLLTWLAVWPDLSFAVAFSRLAGAALALNLIAGSYFMCQLAGPRCRA